MACLFLLIAAGFVTLFFSVRAYNQKERSAVLSESAFDGEKFVFDDFTLLIQPRDSDTAAWNKDPIYDEAGNEQHCQMVGTIYEATVTNLTGNIISDWRLKLVMPEDLWVNNGWNGTFELHQTSSASDVLVQDINLMEPTKTPILLDYYTDHTGPMIPLRKGDFFYYNPNANNNEVPIKASDIKNENYISVLMGFITYIPHQGVDYVTSFTEGEIVYHMERSITSEPMFIVLISLLALWCVGAIAIIVSQLRVRKLVMQRKHDAQIIEQSISTFINFIEAKDDSTKGHSLRVAQYSKMIAKDMGYPEDDLDRIYYIALMHDCGKISIPRTILAKPARLTDEEYELIKKHTTYGNYMLRNFTSIKDISLGAMYHHERYDGKGYPSGIAGEDIPMIARIICVADSLDAMNSDRLYRKRIPVDKIISELTENRGKQFDPKVIDCVLRLIDNGVIRLADNKQ